MCKISNEEILRSLPVMLSDDALSYLSSNANQCASNGNATTVLRKWYNFDEKKARILTEWQGMTLSKAMSQSPHESDVSVFRTFVTKLMTLQKQLDTPYHTVGFLRDRRLIVVDPPAIHGSFRDRMPRSSQQAVHRISNQLSDEVKSSGSACACVAHLEDEESDAVCPEVMYALCKTFGGNARQNHKTPWATSSNFRGRGNISSRGGKPPWI